MAREALQICGLFLPGLPPHHWGGVCGDVQGEGGWQEGSLLQQSKQQRNGMSAPGGWGRFCSLGHQACLPQSPHLPFPAVTHRLRRTPRILGRVQPAEPWRAAEEPVHLLAPAAPLSGEALASPGRLPLEPQPSCGPGKTERG